MALDSAAIAALAALFGGMVSQMIAAWLKRGEMEAGSEASLRREMSERLAAQDIKIDKLTADSAEWQRRYYEAQAKLILSESDKAHLQAQIDDLTAENAHLQAQLTSVQTELAVMRGQNLGPITKKQP
jgi:hypothetical protein